MSSNGKISGLLTIAAIAALCAAAIHFSAGAGFCQKSGAASKSDIKEVSLPENFRNIENLRFAIKKLKNMFVSYSSAYNENDGQLKTFVSDLVSCLEDCDISAMESAGLAESLAETIVRLKVMPDEQKRIYDQFVRVMDEAGVKRGVSNKIADDARDVAEMISKGKDAQGAPYDLIYKYYGVNAKGHAAHKLERDKGVVRGKSSFFGTGKTETSEMMKKYGDDPAENNKKIIGIEFMDPVAARDNAAASAAAKEEKKDAETIIKEKTSGNAQDASKSGETAKDAGKKTE
ncbi:MAG: hypothetical protein A2008_09880 [Candidatus Wallbacteria bacterium GWC2_49_35]|uniref:DUF5667 domain-containing protein n=1 Tax=Candidatus Wallbacteria bacterium GWC2_49_35 TaxID=1817813 RepID=A0A1F7WDQ6_9BACT|nr:MAG: hypothetical protein A2008_09880 [Candidatus Wallbacteria bacterium GWC2_49_35]HBC75958.1 hypothetical protein [Candidatus Wallbacteria bacterium]